MQPELTVRANQSVNMLVLKVIDGLLLIGLILAMYWVWKHYREVQRAVLRNNAMPREASRGLVYGFFIILFAGALMVSLYWLF